MCTHSSNEAHNKSINSNRQKHGVLFQALCAGKIMRTFSEFEKKIIEHMIVLDEKSGSLNVIGNIFDSFSKELGLPDYCYIKS